MKTFKILYEESDSVLALSAGVMKDFESDLGVSFEITPTDFIQKPSLESYAKEGQTLRVPLSQSLAWMSACLVLPVKVSSFGAADAFTFQMPRWNPELLIEKALHQTIIREAHHVDIRESAYIIGNGPLLRVVAGVALGLGFRRAYLVGEDENDLIEQKELLKRVFIGAEIVTLPTHSLTLQTVGASLLINTLELKDRAELSADLAYFNFMKKGGLVLDLYGFQSEHPVLEEAHRAGLRVVPAYLVSAGCDLILLQNLKLDTTSIEKKYFEAWLSRSKSQV